MANAKSTNADDDFLMRTWAIIDLDALSFNIAQLRKNLPERTKLMAVVKADAYGHGDAKIAEELVENGVDFLAVSNIEEAAALRAAAFKGSASVSLLILGFTPVHLAKKLADADIAQTILSYAYAKRLDDECKRLGVRVRVHIKLDTGMNRIGVTDNEGSRVIDEVEAICKLKNLIPEGIFTHLSSADGDDEASVAYTQMQVSRYDSAVSSLEKRGLSFSFHHLQNSAGIACLRDKSYEYARAGIVLYGVAPSEAPLPFPLMPVMAIKSVISMKKTIEAGEAISYGRKFVTTRKTDVATVPIGYADGYSRLLSNKGYLLIRGKRAPILGNICMDQLMVDVTDIKDACEGDIVTVVGIDNGIELGFNDLAKLIGTIGYELMCLVSRRVPRVYKKFGKTVAVVDYII